ncbi:Signal recognition particle 14 kDa protein [Glycine soja]|uniref:Signal recognition particle 14 kDa protein n=2 Tax=Glycine subgen. Soja TaxID=1462606 RepID=A0A0R0GZH5_SOYBN|nr:Signal recognition particle 14 kDa protein [Glycine soja]
MVLKRVFQSSHSLFVIFHSDSKGEQNETEARVQSMIAVTVTSSLKSKVQRNKLATAGEAIEYRCLIRATDGKKTISTSVGPKDHQRFQASYATILKAHMTALKKRERKDKKKPAEADKREGSSKRPKKS